MIVRASATSDSYINLSVGCKQKLLSLIKLNKMANNNHFKIKKDSVKKETVNKTGFSKPVERVDYSDHGREIKIQFDRTITKLNSKVDININSRVFMQMSTLPDLQIKHQKIKIEKLGFSLISTYPNNSSIGIVSLDKDDVPKFKNKIDEYIETNSRRTYIAPIESISEVPIQTKIDLPISFTSNDEVKIVIDIYRDLSLENKNKLKEELINYISGFGSKIRGRIFEDGILSIRCTIKEKDIPEVISKYNAIQNVIYNRSIVSRRSVRSINISNDIVINPPESNSAIAIVDSGISSSDGLLDGIIKDRVNCLPDDSVVCEFSHGTFVASRCVFGDDLEHHINSGALTPYCKVIDISVFGLDANNDECLPTEYDLREAVEDSVINLFEDVRVYNLSLGLQQTIKDKVFTPLARLLDSLSRKYDVLFVVASGNLNELKGVYPDEHFDHEDARIGPPGESLLSLTVGSIAKYSNEYALAEINEVSPFSCIGPGADGGIKPELVAHGGNMSKPFSISDRLSVHGLDNKGLNLANDVGTSYAAPIISQFAQRLIDQYPSSNINTIKALLIHFAEDRSSADMLNYGSDYTGFGEPNIVSSLHGTDYNVTYVYEGVITDSQYELIKFHIPICLSENEPNTKLKIKSTIVMNPPVNGSDMEEYCLCRMTAKLSKASSRGNIGINIDSSSKYYRKWSPIMQFEKSFTRLYSPGIWELKLRLYTRGDLDENFQQSYSCVIEVMDEKENANVYEDIIDNYGNEYSILN